MWALGCDLLHKHKNITNRNYVLKHHFYLRIICSHHLQLWMGYGLCHNYIKLYETSDSIFDQRLIIKTYMIRLILNNFDILLSTQKQTKYFIACYHLRYRFQHYIFWLAMIINSCMHISLTTRYIISNIKYLMFLLITQILMDNCSISFSPI